MSKNHSDKNPNEYLYRKSYRWIVWLTVLGIPAILGYLGLDGLEEVLLSISIAAVVISNNLRPAGFREKITSDVQRDQPIALKVIRWAFEVGAFYLCANFGFLLAVELAN
jgi:hypothetical protein